MPRQFDPRRHVEYLPPEFTQGQKMMYPEDDGDYYFDDEGLPVNLSDDMIMRAHYLDLGMSRLLQKYRDGALSDQEYIQYHRMNGELRGLLSHIWNIGKRALKQWVEGHLKGGNPTYGIGITNIEKLIETLEELGLPAQPALDVMEGELGYDFDDEVKRLSIGAPPLYDQHEYEDEEDQQRFDEALAKAGVSDLDEVEPDERDKWAFLKEQLENWYDPNESGPYSGYGDKYTPLHQKNISPRGEDPKNPDAFWRGRNEEDEQEFSSYQRGFVNEEDWYQESPHVGAYAEMRLHPEYQAAIDEKMTEEWDPINNMRDHRELLGELDMDEEQWGGLDTQTQMALISRLMMAQHRTGNILTDNTPSFKFQSGRYEPRGDWVGHHLGNAPSLESNALKKMLDDLNQSPMVESWDRMMTEHPHERWSNINHRMVRLSSRLDRRGHHRLADHMDRIAFADVHPAKRISPERFQQWLEWFRSKPEIEDARIVGSRSDLPYRNPRPGSDWDIAVVIRGRREMSPDEYMRIATMLHDEWPTRHLPVDLIFIDEKMGDFKPGLLPQSKMEHPAPIQEEIDRRWQRDGQPPWSLIQSIYRRMAPDQMSNIHMEWPFFDEVIKDYVDLTKEGRHATASTKKRKSHFQVLKEHRIELTPEERKKVMDADAVWHHGPGGAPSPAVWKAVIDDKTTFICNTHRAFQERNSLDAAIKIFHSFIKGTA